MEFERMCGNTSMWHQFWFEQKKKNWRGLALETDCDNGIRLYMNQSTDSHGNWSFGSIRGCRFEGRD
jgi:hypothetical protein